jgi:hypothetical protein
VLIKLVSNGHGVGSSGLKGCWYLGVGSGVNKSIGNKFHYIFGLLCQYCWFNQRVPKSISSALLNLAQKRGLLWALLSVSFRRAENDMNCAPPLQELAPGIWIQLQCEVHLSRHVVMMTA